MAGFGGHWTCVQQLQARPHLRVGPRAAVAEARAAGGTRQAATWRPERAGDERGGGGPGASTSPPLPREPAR